MDNHVISTIPEITETLCKMYSSTSLVEPKYLESCLKDFIMFTIYPWNHADPLHTTSKAQYASGFLKFLDIWKQISPVSKPSSDLISIEIDAIATIKNISTWILFKFHHQ